MPTDWVGATASRIGSRHRRRGADSEDAHGHVISSEQFVMAIADGHGSDRYPRAGRGARLAVEVVLELLPDLSLDKKELGNKIVQGWRHAVEADLEIDPPPVEHDDERTPPSHLLYGTTVIAVAVSGEQLRIVQLGDGDVLIGRKGSTRARRPIPPSAHDHYWTTDSLCQIDAAERIHVVDLDLASTPIDVVMIATDGLSVGFVDPDWHDQTMNDLINRLPAVPVERLETEVGFWCEAPAEIGGDDTTIGVVARRSTFAA